MIKKDKKEKENVITEKNVKCINCDTVVKMFVWSNQDMSDFVCQKCKNGEIELDDEG